MKGSPELAQFAVYKTTCSGINTVDEFSSNNSVFNLFPNPSNGQVTIELSNKIGKCNLAVINLLGEIVFNEIINEQTTILKLNLNTGLYFVSLEENGHKIIRILIVE